MPEPSNLQAVKAKPFNCIMLFVVVVKLTLSCTYQSASTAVTKEFNIEGDLRGIKWLADDILIGERIDGSIWFLGFDGGLREQLILPDDPLCQRMTRYRIGDELSDGRVSLIKECLGRWPNKTASDRDVIYLLAYDVITQNLNNLMSKALPKMIIRRTAWHPSMTRGILLESNSLQGVLHWVDINGLYPINATVNDDNGNSWTLNVDFDNAGTAVLPGDVSWSPDGETIAFWASLDAIGREGFSRANGEWQLYLMSPTLQQPISVLRGIYTPERLQWSPDGRWLAFFGRAGSEQRYGVWLFSPTTGELQLLTDAQELNALSLDWSPDGKEILVVSCDEFRADFECVTTRVRIYNIGQIISSP